MRAAADRRIEHGDALGAEALGKTARGKRVDRAHAQDDVTLFGGSDNPFLAEDPALADRQNRFWLPSRFGPVHRRIFTKKLGSQQTPCWRERDSNPRSPG